MKTPQDRLISQKKPVTVKVPICTDSEIADAYNEARSALESAERIARVNPTADHAKAEKSARDKFKSISAQMSENQIVFVFRSIGRKRWDDLLKDHPVTEDVKDKARAEGSTDDDLEQLSWNPYTFPQAAVRASCMSPELSDEDINEIFEGDSWNAIEITALFLGALQANTTRRVVDLGKD